MYFLYFALLTVIYLVCAAVVIIRHYRNQAHGESGASDQAAPTELNPLATNVEVEPLSNGKSAKA